MWLPQSATIPRRITLASWHPCWYVWNELSSLEIVEEILMHWKKRCLKLVTNWFGFLYFQKYGMIPNIFRYAIPHQANPYQKGNSNSIHYGFRGQNHNPVLRFNPIPIQSIPMKSRFKHLENGVYGKSTKRRLQDVSIPDFLTTIH